MEITPLNPADYESVAHLHGACFHSQWTASAFRRLCEQPGVWGETISEDGKLIALILCRQVSDEAEILTFCVAEERRNQGIARKLLLSTAEKLLQEGVCSLFLEVQDDNEAAIALYTHHGFEQVGRRKGYYHTPDGKLRDALTLRRELN